MQVPKWPHELQAASHYWTDGKVIKSSPSTGTWKGARNCADEGNSAGTDLKGETEEWAEEGKRSSSARTAVTGSRSPV